jgi:hypothetical protein
VSAVDEISPAEIVRDILVRLSTPGLAPGGIFVGPANDEAQQLGCISIMAAGLPVVEKYTPVQWVRAQMRCLAGSLSEADAVAQAAQRDLHGRSRLIARMASTDQRYLVHLINVTAGPSMHFDSAETWEVLLFAEVMVGTTPIT